MHLTINTLKVEVAFKIPIPLNWYCVNCIQCHIQHLICKIINFIGVLCYLCFV